MQDVITPTPLSRVLLCARLVCVCVFKSWWLSWLTLPGVLQAAEDFAQVHGLRAHAAAREDSRLLCASTVRDGRHQADANRPHH